MYPTKENNLKNVLFQQNEARREFREQFSHHNK